MRRKSSVSLGLYENGKPSANPSGWGRQNLFLHGFLRVILGAALFCSNIALAWASEAGRSVVDIPARLKTSAIEGGKVMGAGGIGRSILLDGGVGPLGPTLVGSACQFTSHLGPLGEEVAQGLKRRRGVEKGRLQVGIGRKFDQPVRVDGATVASTEWSVLASGWRIIMVDVSSQGALGVRVHLESLKLPGGARLLVYDSNRPALKATPITAADIGEAEDAWSETVFAERVIVECEAPPGADLRTISFNVTGVSHLYQSPYTKSFKEGSCNNDVSCYSEWAEEAAGTARIMFVDGGSTYLCTGCLLNAKDASTALNYFLTANHCINNQKIASTLELYWFYQTSTCNGTPPSLTSVPHTAGGADFLAGASDNDFAFMRLRQGPPNGVYYLGWTSRLPATGDNVISIHHPDAAYKRISFGTEVGTDGTFWQVQWSSGVTETGSSGAPLFNAQHQVIGQLYGGMSSCGIPTGIDMFGRFDAAYNAIKRWLDPGNQAAGTVSPPVTNSSAVISPAKGSYNGLFQEPAGATQQSAGSFTLTLNNKARFSGRMELAGGRYALSGHFDSIGYAQVTVSRRNLNPVTVGFQVNSTNWDQLMGTLSDGTWTAQLQGERAGYDGRTSLAPQAGHYTMIIPGNSVGGPRGDSYATVTATKAGRIRFVGGLADGTRITQAATLSASGRWPLYVRLYGGQGMILSWMTFTNATDQDLSGDIRWIKATTSAAKYYAAGFDLGVTAVGSRYQAPAPGTPLLNLNSASVVLSGGNPALSLTNYITVDMRNRVTNLSSNKLCLVFAPASGSFRGRVVNPETLKWLPFGGVVLQKQNVGYGCFMIRNQSGGVLLQGTEQVGL
jgi:hypothetical protein